MLRRCFVGISGLLVLIIAMLSFIDVLCFNATMVFSDWGNRLGGTAMALPTAVCLILLGAGMMTISLTNDLWSHR